MVRTCRPELQDNMMRLGLCSRLLAHQDQPNPRRECRQNLTRDGGFGRCKNVSRTETKQGIRCWRR